MPADAPPADPSQQHDRRGRAAPRTTARAPPARTWRWLDASAAPASPPEACSSLPSRCPARAGRAAADRAGQAPPAAVRGGRQRTRRPRRRRGRAGRARSATRRRSSSTRACSKRRARFSRRCCIAYPGHARAAELMARLEALEAARCLGEAEPRRRRSRPDLRVAPVRRRDGRERTRSTSRRSWPSELGDLGEAPPRPAGGRGLPVLGGRGLHRVQEGPREGRQARGRRDALRPRASPTRRWASSTTPSASSRSRARAASGSKKEVDCLTMIGMLQGDEGRPRGRSRAFKEGFASEHATGEAQQGAALRARRLT